MALVKSLYVLPTWTRTVLLVTEHAALRSAMGYPEAIDVPSVFACYRFTAKLREHKTMVDACIAARSSGRARPVGLPVDRGFPVGYVHHGPWLRRRCDLRRLRVAGYPSRGPVAGNALCQARQSGTAEVRPRRLDVRRFRREAWRGQVPVPDRRMLARLGLDQGRPLADPDSSGVGPLEGSVLRTSRGRAGFRSAQARMALLPLRVRRIERVALHVDLTMLAVLATALAKPEQSPSPLRAVPAPLPSGVPAHP
jgi:hypothetical protein